MTTKVAFKAMYKAIGFSDDAATKLTDTEFLDSMPKLSRITSARTFKICKAIRSPGGAGAGVHVTEGAEHNLMIAAAIDLNDSFVLRTIQCAEIRLDPSGLFDLHEGQQLLEGQWVNKEWADSFRPLSENDLKMGWKVLREDFHDHTNNVRGAVTKAPIAYLMRNRLIPFPEDDDDEDEYADFDQQLIARNPIIQAAHASVAEETLEKSGPRKKRPQVNGDNTVLFHLSKYVFEKPAGGPMQGRLKVISMGIWLSAFYRITWRSSTPWTI